MGLEKDIVTYGCPLKIGDTVYIRKRFRDITGYILNKNEQFTISGIYLNPKYMYIYNSIDENNVKYVRGDADCFSYFLKDEEKNCVFIVPGSFLTLEKDGHSFKHGRVRRSKKLALGLALTSLALAGIKTFDKKSSAVANSLLCATSFVTSLLIVHDYSIDINGHFEFVDVKR